MAYGHAYPRRSAPVSVHLVALMQYLGGLVVLFAAGLLAFFALAGQRVPAQVNGVPMPPELRGIENTLLGVAAVIGLVGLLAIVIGRKLQRGRQWARVLVLVLSALDLASALYAGFVQGTSPRGIAAIVVPVLYLGLLNTPSARSWFRAHTY
jgi:hypothetical protein